MATVARERVREWRLRHPISEIRLEVFTYYGGGNCACIKCGFSDIRALSIDHIGGRDSQPHARAIAGENIYRWLRNQDFPAGYQTLCMNCQYIKRTENNEFSKYK